MPDRFSEFSHFVEDPNADQRAEDILQLSPNLNEGVSKSFRIGLLEWELQMVQLSATRYSCIAVSWVSLMNFAAITLCVASERVFVVVYFVIGSVRKLLDTPSYIEFL
jgi:hypothetical protein